MSTPHTKSALSVLVLGALGVVFGDIGTSPLYTLRECLHAIGLPIVPHVVLGILSMIVWSLILIVTVEYVSFVMRADNRGEGGIFALTTLAFSYVDSPRLNSIILTLGLMGAGLFYGDALITPAISVLSAVEGLKVVSPALEDYVMPITVAVIMGLFSVQKYGTGKVGLLFGPIIVLWFGSLAYFGLSHIGDYPEILHALNPFYAIALWKNFPAQSFLVMGSVVLAITGAEALYADMGHFGRTAIRIGWLGFVLPSLILNYFGQGALVLADPTHLENPFFHLVPDEYQLAMVILATAATVIASQAVISGAFSITQQAIMLGYMPRLKVEQTSESEIGQVYIPALNTAMMILVVMLVLVFGSSSKLAAAYGIAVTGTMVITTILTAVVLVRRQGWNIADAVLFICIFSTLDSLFFSSNVLKIPHGGWFPLLLGGLVFIAMNTWVKGRKVAKQHHIRFSPDIDYFLQRLPKAAYRPPQTAVYLTSTLNAVPPALTYNLQHNNVLHQQVILLKIARARLPRYPANDRIAITFQTNGFTSVTATYGFMERPDVPAILRQCTERYNLTIQFPDNVSYILSHHSYVASRTDSGLKKWQEPIFLFLDMFSQSAITYFRIPQNQVVMIGAQVEI